MARAVRMMRMSSAHEPKAQNQPSENRVYYTALSLRTRTPGARALVPATRCQSSGSLGVLLSPPALDVRLMTALQVLQVKNTNFEMQRKGKTVRVRAPALGQTCARPRMPAGQTHLVRGTI